MNASRSREVWRLLEPVHAVTYFTDECRTANKAVGLRGFWMGYFAARAAPMGPVGPGVVEATFYNFHPAMVRRAIPDAWAFAAPSDVLAARSRSAAAALARLVPGAGPTAGELSTLLLRALDRIDVSGRPLCAANRDVIVDGGPLELVWQAATTLREHRGDGHVAVLTEAGIDGCEAHVLYAATESVRPGVLQENRGWSDDEWRAAGERLEQRGLLDRHGEPTEKGGILHGRVEERTDDLAIGPYAALGEEGVDQLVRLLQSIARPIVSSGEIPFPNPIGLRSSRST